MKKLLILSVFACLFSCTKQKNAVCATCNIVTSANGIHGHKYTNDTVQHCGNNEQDINGFIRENTKLVRTKDSLYTSDITCQ